MKYLSNFSLFFLLLFISVKSLANDDWSDCENDLNKIRKSSKNIQNMTDEMQNMTNELNSKYSEVQDCKNNEEFSHCNDIKYEYSNKKSEFNGEFENLINEFEFIQNRLARSKISCGIQVRTISQEQLDDSCKSLREGIKKMGMYKAMNVCKLLDSADKCNYCIERLKELK